MTHTHTLYNIAQTKCTEDPILKLKTHPSPTKGFKIPSIDPVSVMQPDGKLFMSGLSHSSLTLKYTTLDCPTTCNSKMSQ
mmetsp:Transcript_22333/g.33279  ORF Transcript_22333/g.33279 Transcript_22333/m.33279 type:complete len:80 (+) Transcript_22333:2-241(+)